MNQLLKRTLLFVVALCLGFVMAGAQRWALKTNLLYGGALTTPNMAIEFRIAPRWTFDVSGGVNSFFYSTDPTSASYKTKKLSHWMVQPEVRYWTCDAFNGLFLGLHAQGGAFNVGGMNIPFVLENKDGVMKNHRYEGYLYGAGISAGYHLMLSNRFSLEFQLGVGYNRIVYDKFACTKCGKMLSEGTANYIGPTKAAISLVYIIK